MGKNWRIFKLIAIICLLLTVWTGPTLAADNNKPLVLLDVLTVNDFHGALVAEGSNPGAGALVQTIRKLSERNPRGTLILSAGDMLTGTIEADMLASKPVLAVMERAGLAAMALGNHEFNLPAERLAGVAKSLPLLAANVVRKDNGNLPDFVKPYIIVNRSGVNIGIVGLATPESAYKAHPREASRYKFLDPVESANKAIREIAGKTDIIILLTHLGSEQTADGQLKGEVTGLIGKVPGAAAIITGHSHKRVAVEIRGIPVVQAEAYGRAVGKVTLLYSRLDKKVVSASAVVIDVSAEKNGVDGKTDDIVAQAKRQLTSVRNEVLTTSAPELSHDRWTLSPLGCYAADILRQAFKADVAVINGGALRASLSGGRTTAADVYRILPFEDRVETAYLNGRAIREMLEYGIFNTKVGIVQYSGLKIQADSTRPEGSRLRRIVLADGRELSDNQWYKVAANSFLAAGGDNYSWFEHAKNRQEWKALLRDVLAVGLQSGLQPAGNPTERLLQL